MGANFASYFSSGRVPNPDDALFERASFRSAPPPDKAIERHRGGFLIHLNNDQRPDIPGAPDAELRRDFFLKGIRGFKAWEEDSNAIRMKWGEFEVHPEKLVFYSRGGNHLVFRFDEVRYVSGMEDGAIYWHPRREFDDPLKDASFSSRA